MLSAGPEAYLAETLLIYSYPAILKFIREVATTEDFRNPRYEIIEAPPEPDDTRYWNGDIGTKSDQADGETKGADDQKQRVSDETDPAEAPKTAEENEQQTQKPNGENSAAAVKESVNDVTEDQ